jgi:hypothetical protein
LLPLAPVPVVASVVPSVVPDVESFVLAVVPSLVLPGLAVAPAVVPLEPCSALIALVLVPPAIP